MKEKVLKSSLIVTAIILIVKKKERKLKWKLKEFQEPFNGR